MRGEPGSGLRYAALLILTGMSVFSQVPQWKDPSPHRVQFVHVEDAVQIEVLDWGGSGRALCCWPVLEIPPTSLTISRPN